MLACTCHSLLDAWRTYPHFSLYLGGSPDSNLLAAITSNLVNHQEHTLSGLTLLGSQQPISSDTIEQWFTILLEHQKGSFSLNFSFQFQWFLPATIFQFGKLCSLSLTNCTIELVDGFSFPFLEKLTLQTCTFIDESTNSLELLIAGCPKVKEIEVKEPNLPDGGVYSATTIKAPLLTCLTLILGSSAMNWTVFSTDIRAMHIETSLSVHTDFFQQFRSVTSLFVEAHSIMVHYSFWTYPHLLRKDYYQPYELTFFSIFYKILIIKFQLTIPKTFVSNNNMWLCFPGATDLHIWKATEFVCGDLWWWYWFGVVVWHLGEGT